MYDYIYENNLMEHINYVDTWDGNSIYHNLVLSENTKQIQKLLDSDQFNFFVKNKYDQTPVDVIESLEINKIISLALLNKLKLLTEKYESEKEINIFKRAALEKKINYLESDEYKKKVINEITFLSFIKNKLLTFFENNKFIIISMLMGLILVEIYFILFN
jgi:hypothetical protein